MYSMVGVKGGKTVGIGRGGKYLIKKKKELNGIKKLLIRNDIQRIFTKEGDQDNGKPKMATNNRKFKKYE